MKGRKQDSKGHQHSRVLILVDESNVGSSVRTAGRGLDWLKLRGIRVEVASVAANLGNTLRSAANAVIDLAPLFRTFDIMKVQDSPTATSPRPQQRRRRLRFRPPASQTV